jgi:tripartite-type tricarboxylate transporter receptor subunit TctC
MGSPRRLSRRLATTAFLSVLASGTSLAQTYPAKPVRVIVPFAPGGGSDIAARVMSQKLGEHFGQSFVPDNRPGAGGLVGAEVAVKAPPDGYTIMISTSSWVTGAAIHKPAFDPISNLAPIAEIGFNPLVVSVHPSLPCRTTKELIALARSKPGDLAVATPGVGSITHLATELFLSMAKIKVITVPYKSTGATMSDVLTGRTQFIIGGLLPLQPYIQPGKLRAIAVTTAKRWPTLPDLPAVGETLSGYEVESWYGAVAPRGRQPPSSIA